jgi:hypothetical protein
MRADQNGRHNPALHARTMKQLEDNLRALDVVLSAERRARLDTVSAVTPVNAALRAPKTRLDCVSELSDRELQAPW